MWFSMSNKPFDAVACDFGGQASATNGLTDATNGLSDMKNAPCNRPLNRSFSDLLRFQFIFLHFFMDYNIYATHSKPAHT
jgi:hypothetical protein